MKKIAASGLTCSIFLLFVFGTIVAGAEATWTTQTVDSSGEVRNHPSIALDSSGNPHIAYVVIGSLKYASWNGAKWNVQDVDVGVFPSLVLDKKGTPHILYTGEDENGALGALKYAVQKNSGWEIKKVDKTDASSYNSLALNSQDNPHISYFFSDGRTYGFLKYASWSNSGWNIKDVEQAGNYGDACSLALDTAGNPNISYYYQDTASKPFGSYYIKYAKWADTSWQMQTLDEIGVTLTPSTCIALDAHGNPHISYNVNNNLKYASWTGNEWNKQNLGFGNKGSFVLDKSGNLHISYSGEKGQTYSSWGGSKWDTFTVNQTYGESSLALDTNSNPHICYVESTYTGQQSYKYNLVYTFASIPQTTDTSVLTANFNNKETIIAILAVVAIVFVVLVVLLLQRKRQIKKSTAFADKF
jgi:hypothetical protein